MGAMMSSYTPNAYSFLQDVLRSTENEYSCKSAHANMHHPHVSTSLLWNSTTPMHRDSNNHKETMESLLVGGSFTGGDLLLPDLKTRATYQPGTLVLFRGRTLLHAVGPWEGEQRICLASYTPQNVIRHQQGDRPKGKKGKAYRYLDTKRSLDSVELSSIDPLHKV